MPIVTTKLEGLPTWARARTIAHYGGATDKQNTETEALQPYAWVFYQELRAARGSAYRTYDGTKDGLVHAESLALARSEAARWRAGDKLRFNSLPLTSDEKLGSWVERLAINVFPDDTQQDIRQRCAAKFHAALGPTNRVIDESISELLGPSFVRTYHITGVDLDNPPVPTFWRTHLNGPVAYELHLSTGPDTNTILSSRAHLVVEVVQTTDQTLLQFLSLMNVELFRLLDSMLPIWSTFDWAIDVDPGFLLDISDLDFTGMVP